MIESFFNFIIIFGIFFIQFYTKLRESDSSKMNNLFALQNTTISITSVDEIIITQFSSFLALFVFKLGGFGEVSRPVKNELRVKK